MGAKKPYTQLENETMEALARAPFTTREFRVMLAVIRLTNGFHLMENEVPLQELLVLTGLRRNHLHATLKRLYEWQVVVRGQHGRIGCNGPALWRLPSISPELGLRPSQSQLGTMPQTMPDSPDLGLKQSRLGTKNSPDSGPVSDTTPDSRKKSTKENSKENKKKAPPLRAAGTSVPTSLPAWQERSRGRNPVAVLVDAFRTLHSRAPPEDLKDPGGRLAAMGRACSNDWGYLLKVIWDTSSHENIAGSHLNYIQGYLKERKEGCYGRGRGRHGAHRGYAETRVPATYTDPENYRPQER